ncbi:MAG: AlpA family phage regulatory protein [Pseudomonadota bacterium]|nr:AlpA family phage regulatory protein [Pseudomonadota bacterium]
MTTILRMPGVNSRTGDGRSTIYKKVSERLFTKPIRFGARSVGWPDYEVEAIIQARIAGRSDAEIRQLVVELEAKRRQV